MGHLYQGERFQKKLHNIFSHPTHQPISQISTAPDTGWTISLCAKGKAVFWAISPKEEKPVTINYPELASVVKSAFNGRIYVGFTDGVVHALELYKGKYSILQLRHEKGIKDIAIGSNELIATGSEDGMVKVWKLQPAKAK